MKHVLLATDLSPYSSWAVSRTLILAAEHRATLQTITVVDKGQDQSQIREAVKAQLQKAPGAQHKIVKDVAITVMAGDPYQEILAYSEKTRADLLCIGMHDKRTEALRERFFKTVCERLIRKAELPVLMVCAPPQEPYQRILVGTDFSAGANAAFRQALCLGSDHARYRISHIYQIPGLIRDAYAKKEIEQEHSQALSDFLQKEAAAMKSSKTIDVEIDLREDFTTPGLRAAVQEFQPDLLALGAHGRSGLPLAIIGSTAQDFLLDPPCDILIGRISS